MYCWIIFSPPKSAMAFLMREFLEISFKIFKDPICKKRDEMLEFTSTRFTVYKKCAIIFPAIPSEFSIATSFPSCFYIDTSTPLTPPQIITQALARIVSAQVFTPFDVSYNQSTKIRTYISTPRLRGKFSIHYNYLALDFISLQ